MAYYLVEWKSLAVKDMRKIPVKKLLLILNAISKLPENPRPPGHKKLINSDNAYRIRIGDYRIVYNILDNKSIIVIAHIGHRKDIYN